MKMKNIEGQRIPETTFRTREDGGWKDVSTHDIFAGKRVVVFALPGAFTPTCSSNHVPRYNELAPALRARGIGDIVCISVNDAFVMDAWAKDQHADSVRFLPDGNGKFTAGMGMLVDKTDLGFGQRSWRYSMLVEDGVVKKMFIEPSVEGDPFEVSDADTMLKYLDPSAKTPPDILLIGRAGCSFCIKAKSMLKAHGLDYDEVEANPRRLRAASGRTTTPQIFINGKHIGGADELAAYLKQL
ncbi:MAG: glutathione peroxidase [Polyangiaceae bacterium]|nr:glutathione peroxidase [Polyangiaceae bacterium]